MGFGMVLFIFVFIYRWWVACCGFWVAVFIIRVLVLVDRGGVWLW